MALFSRDPHEHWPKRHFSKNEVANSGLRSRGVTVIEPAAGELACGTEGKGRMADPADILQTVKRGTAG